MATTTTTKVNVKSDFLEAKKNREIVLTEERVRKNIPVFREYISFWREYPDMFIDMIKGEDSKFNFFFYQRVFLRAAMRHRYFFGTFTRAFSKSFLSVLLMMIKCILYPGIKVFITSGGKEQAAGIAGEKVRELCDLVPALHNEIRWDRGPSGSKIGNDDVQIIFKNGSIFNVVANKESSRGGRRHSGLIDEVILVDGEKFSQVIVPMMNVSRRAANGEVDPNDKMNKSQIYITSAGFRDHFSYQKQIQLLVWQIVRPGTAFVMGGTWRTPVKMGLLDRGFVNDLKADGTFDEISFSREYESIWAGSAIGSFFNGDVFDRMRTIKQVETTRSGNGNKDAYYMFGIDVGRNGWQTVISVIKVNPQKKGVGVKSLVNIITFESEHFGEQANEIKRQYMNYLPRYIVIDANGLGIGLVDYLVMPSEDPKTGESFPAFGVHNDEKKQYKNIDAGPNVIKDTLWLIKANAELNFEGYTTLLTQMGSGKLHFLLEEREAKATIFSKAVNQKLSIEERNLKLRPFVTTSILKAELMNLTKSQNNGTQFKLEPINKGIGKDKVSSLMYGIYAIKILEDEDRKRKRGGLANFVFIN